MEHDAGYELVVVGGCDCHACVAVEILLIVDTEMCLEFADAFCGRGAYSDSAACGNGRREFAGIIFCA